MFRTWIRWECGYCPTTPILTTIGAFISMIFVCFYLVWTLGCCRPMKMGEIGIFLSHYNIWKEVILSLNTI